MKKMRKGFTLVELLIVIAIIGTLSATMTASMTGSTVRAKVAAISNNVDAMKNAASWYYTAHMNDAAATLNGVKTSAVLDTYIATWRDFAKDTNSITYTPEASETGPEKWAVTVDFSGDDDADNIKTELAKIKGYGSYPDSDDGTDIDRLSGNKFKVILLSGKIEQITPASEP